jgi:NDP-sugar pyrophosphorylase family protein
MPDRPDAIILCGGAGLRLRSIIGNAPKGMAEVAGRPFLELLLRQLRRHGFERAVLAVGYQRDVIYSCFGENAFGLRLAYSIETSPLGTGGALRNAADLIESENVLIMNGDSYTGADLRSFAADHRNTGADASVLLVPPDGRGDCGSVRLDGTGRVVSFAEKQGLSGEAYVNAGIYLVSRQMLYAIPAGAEVSVERNSFPEWLRQGKYIRGVIYPGQCIDIGTPERYQIAQDILAAAESKTEWQQREIP